jgi:drug/metabolite transporter (DMT)-like permease
VLSAVGLATVGVLAVAWTGRAPGSLIGVAMILGAVICESVFILLNKRMVQPLAPLPQTMMMTALGFVLAVPLALFEPAPIVPSLSALGPLLWYALVPTVGGFLLWYAGAARVTGGEAAAVTAVAPITAVALSALWLGETIRIGQVSGMAAVVLAIMLLALSGQKKRKPA